MAVYVLDENNNRHESLDKEGILSVLAQAIEDGTLENIVADAAFISKLKCCVSGGTYSVAFVKQATYNELERTNKLVYNCYYFIIDDDTADNLDEQLKQTLDSINNINERLITLGFKQGTFILASGSASTNEIKKQGNYVIANLVTSNLTTTITVPAGFRPKEVTQFYINVANTTLGILVSVNVWLGTDGKFYTSEDLTTEYTFSAITFITNIGWEV